MQRRTFLALAVAFHSCRAHADSTYVRVPLGDGASVAVPKNWKVLSSNQRMTIESYVEAKGFRSAKSSLRLAASLLDERERVLATINVHFYPQNPLTQSQVAALTPADVAAIDKEIQATAEAPIKPLGMRITHWYGSRIERIGRLLAFVHEHRQSDTAGTTVLRSRGVRILASPRSFTVTLAYRESDSLLLLPIIDRIASSIQLE